jgi:hypothetical protein
MNSLRKRTQIDKRAETRKSTYTIVDRVYPLPSPYLVPYIFN